MEMASILARQILQMFVLAGLGYGLYKAKLVSQEGSRAMGSILIYLAQTDLAKMIRRKSVYLVSLVRLVAVPAVGLLLLSLLPAELNSMKYALLLAIACPVGSNVAVYAQLHGKDYPYAVETVVVSTILSLGTIPLLMACASSLWGI